MIRRPSLGWYLTEPGRSAVDLGSLMISSPWLAAAPHGDGHPVLVLPGLLATDTSTLVLRRFLRHLGYSVHGWKLGRNLGPTAATAAGMPLALQGLAESSAQPVSVIGWSLGGIYARQLARKAPSLVRQVITLGSPYAMTDPGHARAVLQVPTTSIYSKSDGIVAWQTCREAPGPIAENIAVRCSHLGFGHNPAVLWAVADRLAQDADQRQPFIAPRVLRALYPEDNWEKSE
jgi:pimeloyl-ACP methyl ester carboxylesterase